MKTTQLLPQVVPHSKIQNDIEEYSSVAEAQCFLDLEVVTASNTKSKRVPSCVNFSPSSFNTQFLASLPNLAESMKDRKSKSRRI